jgi:LacI family transcriptional regulator
MKHLTISTIAQKLGVSKMTISRVINNRPGVSPRLRARVMQAIEEMGYQPSAAARNLALRRSNLIGILVPDVVSEWIAPLLLGIGEGADELGFQVLLRSTGRGVVSPKNFHEKMIESSLTDGLVVASWRIPTQYIERLAEKGMPTVVVDGYVRSEKVSWVSSTFRQGIIEAVRYLVDLGHCKIAFLSGGITQTDEDTIPYIAGQQLDGFLAGMKDAGLAPNPAWILHGDYTRESGYQLAWKLLGGEDRPTAVIAGNDPMAAGVLQVAHGMGIIIPKDLSVVGFDDTLGSSTAPPLTSVFRDLKETGRRAMRLLADQIKHSEVASPVVQIDLPTRLVVRQSTCPVSNTE